MKNLTFIYLEPFVDDSRRLGFNDEDLRELEQVIGQDPDAGKIMIGTGGVRKIRFAPPSWHVGKSSGTRIAFAFIRRREMVYLIAAFAKNEKENLSRSECNELKRLMEILQK